MKFSPLAAAVGFLLPFASAKSVPSALFDWSYTLTPSAPVLTSKAELQALSATYNNTVSIESLDGQLSVVEQFTKTQVGILGGELHDWAAAAYPDDGVIANMKKSGEADVLKTELNGLLAMVDKGTTLETALAVRRADKEARGLNKRNCVCPIVVFSCPLFDGCAGVCIFFICTG
ncbi:hypothetical protein QBC34DRAFT_387285 [Podospora aff. communis PSN243]|uniref:Uncharacterized protein n=1 Tax=Podospora aff. communis PSN243 TaxID=3040156 RepID=A0AAV9G0G3_9PEZI|nr:hypothetical protein QBC34DRAFT_387285 [Podospora aff. communis PSN243]